jgi:hypothetical protein
MTTRHRLATGLLLATASCVIASLLAETAAGRVVVVTVLVFVYAASAVDLTSAVYAGAIAWVLLVAFLWPPQPPERCTADTPGDERRTRL